MAITVLLVDDHRIVRDGLRSLLARQPDVEVIGETDSGREAVSLARALRPDIVIMDIEMRDLGGIEATRLVLETTPTTRVLALSMSADASHVTQMLAAGASGYLVKTNAFDELSVAIRTVMGGGVYLSPTVTGVVVDSLVRLAAREPQESFDDIELTGRERELLSRIASGASTKDIADALHVSVKTVEADRRRLMDRLGVDTPGRLIRFALKHGLARLED